MLEQGWMILGWSMSLWWLKPGGFGIFRLWGCIPKVPGWGWASSSLQLRPHSCIVPLELGQFTMNYPISKFAEGFNCPWFTMFCHDLQRVVRLIYRMIYRFPNEKGLQLQLITFSTARVEKEASWGAPKLKNQDQVGDFVPEKGSSIEDNMVASWWLWNHELRRSKRDEDDDDGDDDDDDDDGYADDINVHLSSSTWLPFLCCLALDDLWCFFPHKLLDWFQFFL